MAELTPMMQQYMETKKQYPDCILFYRLGDFYEMFFEDALTASRELEITLTGKNCGQEERAPMCGVPYHAVEGYLSRLVSKGYKVAICEQMEDPKLAKGLVKREVVRIVTPGTNLNIQALEENKNNYIMCIAYFAGKTGISVADVTTGDYYMTEVEDNRKLLDEVMKYAPSEIICNDAFLVSGMELDDLKERLGIAIYSLEPHYFDDDLCRKCLMKHFGVNSLSGLGVEEFPNGVIAAGSLLSYLYDTQKIPLSHFTHIEPYLVNRYMLLDSSTRRNLELTETLRGKEKKGSLLWVLDKTRTAMGARLLRSWLERPLLSVSAIARRNDAVAALVKHTVQREELILALTGIGDMERLMGRIVYGSAGGRDMVSLKNAMDHLPAIRQQLAAFEGGHLRELGARLDPLEDLAEVIGKTLQDDPPFSVREGEFIRDGFDPEVDRLRGILHGGKGIIASMEAAEKEKTGIRTLKIGYNKVFGYYIEVSNSFKELVPETYIRKQTLVNGERYITQELKDLEHDILSASDRDAALEYELFTRLRQTLCDAVTRVQGAAAAVAELDCLCSLAAVAVKNNYCCPVVDESGVIEIHDGRHPVVECMRPDAMFVPNDTYMGEKENRAAIITGPNMAGKSTYMRQVALMVLMAQIGSFVPAKAARIGIVDRIFTRIGASDDLSAGQSTFMVEMTEVSDILRCATSRSLLILDEIGRGTSTFDGMSIARAVLEYCADPKKLGAKTLFATHYHELTAMEGTLPGVKNYNIAVKTRGEDIIFLRKIIPGGADRSYGIEVARLAGLPSTVVNRAKKILRQLEEEAGRPAPAVQAQEDQVSLTALSEGEVIDQLRRAQVDTLSPLEALNLLYELKKKLN